MDGKVIHQSLPIYTTLLTIIYHHVYFQTVLFTDRRSRLHGRGGSRAVRVSLAM